jgi:capsular polysaccharide biosynthesis protein
MYEHPHQSNGRPMLRDATRPTAAPAGAPESEQFFSLREASDTVRRRLWIVVLVALVFVGTTVGFSLLQTPMYGASVKILVGQELGESQPDNLAGSVEGLEQLTQTMVEAIDSRPVAEDVIRRLGLQTTPEALLNELTIEQIEGTQFIELHYEDSDPERTQRVVNAVAEVSSERISHASAGANNVTVTVWERATVPNGPLAPNPMRNGLLALGLGLMLGIGLALLLEYLDDSWRSPEEVEQVSGIPTFGVIPHFELAQSKRRGY